MGSPIEIVHVRGSLSSYDDKWASGVINREQSDAQTPSRLGRGHRRHVPYLRRGSADAGIRQVVGLPAFRLLQSRHMQQKRRLAGA
jgi:hypothetical protein